MDRGQLHKLAQPAVLPNGRRIPGLKPDHPRQLALMHALVRFANIAAANIFTTQEIYPYTLRALGSAPDDYSLASLRYDLYKLRAKELVHKLPRSRRYQLTPQGYSLCLVFLKTLRARLCATHRGSPAPSSRRPQTTAAATNPT